MSEPAHGEAAPAVTNIDRARARREKSESDDAFVWYRWASSVNARPDIRPTTTRVATALAGRADNGTGECWPSEAKLATEAGAKVRTVRRAIAELRALGALEVTPGRGRRTSRYRLIPPARWRIGGPSGPPE